MSCKRYSVLLRTEQCKRALPELKWNVVLFLAFPSGSDEDLYSLDSPGMEMGLDALGDDEAEVNDGIVVFVDPLGPYHSKRLAEYAKNQYDCKAVELLS
eukprot:scaffold8448_cov239-Pinguiococcus_pyrenoidosus.AAC.5